MYRCNDCKKVFEVPAIERDDPSPPGISLPSGHYEWPVCPHCKGDELDKVQPCAVCKGYALYLESLCDDCQGKIHAACTELVDEFCAKGFMPNDVKDVIQEWLEK